MSMKRSLVFAGLLIALSAIPASAVIVARADITYDIESNHAVAIVSFTYQRSSFDGREYQFEVTLQSTSRSISGRINETSFTLIASSTRPPAPPPPDSDPQNQNDNSGCPQYENCNSPIVINLGAGPFRLSGKETPVVFDIDADGRPDRLAWT